jgi:hypothetical protein
MYSQPSKDIHFSNEKNKNKMIKLYIGETPVYFVSADFQIPHQEGLMYTSFEPESVLGLFLELIDKNKEVSCLVIRCDDPKQSFKHFSASYTVVEAAGGVVFNPANEILLIFRNGKWDLPKGKIEKGEAAAEAAIREVEEECGISSPTIVMPLSPSYHSYFLGGNRVLKKTHWYKMSLQKGCVLIPQAEEGITEVRWMKDAEIVHALGNTYPSVRDLIGNLTGLTCLA